jgi:hypothetical protein
MLRRDLRDQVVLCDDYLATTKSASALRREVDMFPFGMLLSAACLGNASVQLLED